VNGGYMINQALRCLPETDDKIFACLESHMSLLPLEEFNNVVWIKDVTEGQACTTAILVDKVPDNNSILLSACDNGALYDSDKFADLIENTENDIVVWSYRNNYTAHHNPNMYSWLDVDNNGYVNKVNVKKFPYGSNPVDEYAVVGTMFFRNKEVYNNLLKNCMKLMKELMVNFM